MKTYMVTMPRTQENFIALWTYINTHDVHKWVIGRETGRGGYEHLQCRLKAQEDFFYFEDEEKLMPVIKKGMVFYEMKKTGQKVKKGWMPEKAPEAHVEEANDDEWDYETKEGMFVASWDSEEALRVRFGVPRWYQYLLIDDLDQTNDRQVLVWVDEKGNQGKSWICKHMVSRKLAYYCPPYLKTIEGMIKWLADLVKQDREDGRPPKKYVIIDIPRTWKWTKELYVAIEAIKDGLLADPRYGSTLEDISGSKVLVLTNTKPKVDTLSEDRWVFWAEPIHRCSTGATAHPPRGPPLTG